MIESMAGGGGHPVLTAGTLVAAVAGEVLATSGGSLSLRELQVSMVALHSAQQSLEAARLHLVRLLAANEEPSAHPGSSTRHFLVDALGIGKGASRSDLDAAKATDPDVGVLRGMGRALAEGQVTRFHLDVARRAVQSLPTGMVRERRDDIDAVLTEHAKAFSPTDAEKLATHLVATVDPRGVEGYADEAYERRSWSTKVDRTGMLTVTGMLDGAGAAEYLAVLDHLAAPGRGLASCEGRGGDDGPQAELDVAADTRTKGQRLADAQVRMAALAAAQLKARTPGDPPRLVVHTTVEQLAWQAEAGTHPGPATCEQVGVLSATTLQLLACDAAVERVVLDRKGAVVSMESLGRLANRALRRALAARDLGCTWPGCSEPPAACDAHHVLWWSRGGPTELANLALLCGRHHREAHREQWIITVRDGVPWFTPPAWLDPGQMPIRNSFHTAAAEARAVGAALVHGVQLRLAAGGGSLMRLRSSKPRTASIAFTSQGGPSWQP